MENIYGTNISVNTDEADSNGENEQRNTLDEGGIGEKGNDVTYIEKENDEKDIEKENDEKDIEKENDEKDIEKENEKIVEKENEKIVEKENDSNSKCNDWELQNKKIRSCKHQWKGSSIFGKLFDSESKDYIKYNTSPGLLERSENINDKQSKNIGNSKANIYYQSNRTDTISMYNFNPYQLGYQPNNGLNPSQGYVFIYPHITKNSKPPKIKKNKKLACC
ncbi:conserved Plasmodium protein, unknown function [Plasmodium berghei]|uniref:Uncharacterized protein n=1 Tax=Plasmodium berghei TaxID=5821 RepID=A0A1D3S5T6_PLABE|nr:conserved Plasmodium protein, unknown function [Plasmodium berghei]